MSIVSNNIVQFLLTVIQFYSFVVLARVIMTWIPNISRSNPIVVFIHQITEPPLKIIRETLPSMGAMDFSPLVLLISLHILRAMMAGMLVDM
jgi:YggT family protein